MVQAPDSKELWRVIRSLGLVSSAPPSPFNFFSAESINKHFATICRQHVPSSSEVLSDILSVPVEDELTSFDFRKIEIQSLISICNSAKVSGAKGADGLSRRHLLCAMPSVGGFLSDLFNLSLESGVFPDAWKKVLVRPIVKSNIPESLGDLCRVVYIERRNLFSERQCGYRKGHSTQAALLGLTDSIKRGMNESKVTILVLFGLSKAFDTVDHALLLKTLRKLNCGNEVIRWLYSYLKDRFQAVVGENGVWSNWVRLTCGVPQGSILGPLLFLLFMNDLPNVIQYCKSLMFVDDTQIYLECEPRNLQAGVDRVTIDVNAFMAWTRSNGITVNLKKTKAMIIGTRAHISRIDLKTCPQIVACDAHVESARNLGVWLDNTLSWKTHVGKTIGRIYGALWSLKVHRHSLTQELRKNLVQ